MKQKKFLSSEKNKREKVFFTILAILILILIVLIWTNDRGLNKYIQNLKEYEQLEKEMTKLKEENEILKKEIKLMEKDQYFYEKVAREDLNMIKEGEIIIKFDDREIKEQGSEKDKEEKNIKE